MPQAPINVPLTLIPQAPPAFASWVPNTDQLTPCAERPEWFDIDEPAAHTWAANLCDLCPLQVECRKAAIAKSIEGVFGGWRHRRIARGWQFTYLLEVRLGGGVLCPIPGCTAEFTRANAGPETVLAHCRKDGHAHLGEPYAAGATPTLDLGDDAVVGLRDLLAV